MKHRQWILLIGILIFTLFTRFISLNWGAPFYFHPDERNIASSISQLVLPNQLNPHFFAYGSLPIYSIFFLGVVVNYFSSCHFSFVSCHVTFEQAIILSRIYSALLSCGIVFLLYEMSKKLYTEQPAWIVTLLALFSTGFIQFSHFGTFEMWTTCFSLVLCYLLLFPYKNSKLNLLCIGIISGVLISTKISNLVFLPLTWLLISLPFIKHISKQIFIKQLVKICVATLFVTVISVGIFLVSNPFILLDPTSFLGSMNYETSVALGTLPVFYTQEFSNTIPFLYQYLKVFPFLLTPLVAMLLPLFLCVALYKLLKVRSYQLFVICSFFLVTLIPQAILFVKWIRYMLPTLPFIYLLLGEILSYVTLKKYLKVAVSVLLIGSAIIHSMSYVFVVFIMPDSRISAAEKAKQLMPTNTAIMSEVYDLGITPFNQYFPFITLVNFYDLETQPQFSQELSTVSQTAKAVILPSQRIISTRLNSPQLYPKGYAFYQDLENQSHYKKLYETPCDLPCQIVYLGDPISRFEQTATVFDHPTVMIYKKR